MSGTSGGNYRKWAKHPYSVKFRLRNGTTTEKKFESRSDRNREAAALRDRYGDQIVWLKIKDK